LFRWKNCLPRRYSLNAAILAVRRSRDVGGWQELDFQRSDNCLGDLILHREDVRQPAVIAFDQRW